MVFRQRRNGILNHSNTTSSSMPNTKRHLHTIIDLDRNQRPPAETYLKGGKIKKCIKTFKKH